MYAKDLTYKTSDIGDVASEQLSARPSDFEPEIAAAPSTTALAEILFAINDVFLRSVATVARNNIVLHSG